MNFTESKREYRFEGRDAAKWAKDCLNAADVRIQEVRLRKSLPRFKGHVCREYSLFILAHSLADTMQIRQIIGRLKNRQA